MPRILTKQQIKALGAGNEEPEPNEEAEPKPGGDEGVEGIASMLSAALAGMKGIELTIERNDSGQITKAQLKPL